MNQIEPPFDVCCIVETPTAERAFSTAWAMKRISTRIDKARACSIILGIKPNANSVDGAGKKGLLSDPGVPVLRLGGRKRD